MINCIQNKSFYIIYVCTVYRYTHKVYILKIFTIYIIYKSNIFLLNAYMHVFVFIYTDMAKSIGTLAKRDQGGCEN